MPMKTGVFGGTFDPIHKAHLRLAEAAKSQYGLDRVFFIPARIPPHKAQQRTITPALYRFKMVELALKGRAGFEACDLELNRDDLSYTVDTLRALKKKYPQDEFYLILGADSAESFSSWREPDEIAKLAVLLVAPREGFKADSGYSFRGIDCEKIDVAGTQLRQCWEAGKPFPPGMLTPEVEAFIKKMNLYQKVSRGPAS